MSIPRDSSEAARWMGSVPIPRGVRKVAERLEEAGHAAYVVGGAVRDLLLGRPSGDWDLASSATPSEVQALFRRTIPTGVEHGTVTVLVGAKGARESIEVTTFRGEGDYRDGRRPGEVRFLRALEEDLARRDFTINALAYRPTVGEFVDAYAGLDDLRAGVVRAVGDARERFAEDGLRIMRGLRFSARLGFRLDQAAVAAIPGALAVFDRVSRERVRDELWGLLAAQDPGGALELMASSGLWSRIWGPTPDEEIAPTIAAICRLGGSAGDAGPLLDEEWVLRRIARGLWPLRPQPQRWSQTLDQLKPSRVERRRLGGWSAPAADALRPALAEGAPAVRRVVAELGREEWRAVAELLELEPELRAQIEEAVTDVPLTVRELAIGARELIAEGVASPGPQLGRLLDELLAAVLDDPSANTPEHLMAFAKARQAREEA